MKHNCPTCQRVLYNRRLKRCGFCAAPIPDELRFTPEETAALERKMAELEAERRMRQLAQEAASAASAAQIPFIIPIILSVAIAALTGCSRAPVVTIINHSTNVLNNVVLSGSGFSNRIDSIAAGGRGRITVHPKGESGLRVTFNSGGQQIDADDLAYIEARGGYSVAVTVQPDLKVSASSNIRAY